MARGRVFWHVLVVAACFLPAVAWAQVGVDQPFTGLWQLSPPASDASVMFLGQLFGSVGGVLGSTSGQIMGQIFKAFNYGLILIAGSMLSYTVIMSVINTAQDGQFMGQEKKGAWVILRSVGGISFLVPHASGYSFIQIFVMWAVVSGVGLADLAWTRVLNYLEHGGAVFVQPLSTTMNKGTIQNIGGLATQVISSGICLSALEQGVQQQYQKAKATAAAKAKITGSKPPAVTKPPTHQWGAFFDSDGSTLYFGDQTDPSLKNICGSIAVPQNAMNLSADNKTYAQAYLKQALLMMYQEQRLLARIWNQPDVPKETRQDALATAIARMVMNFYNILQPVMKMQANAEDAEMKATMQKAKATGWIMAGAYYYTITTLNAKAVALSDNLIPKPGQQPDYTQIGNSFHIDTEKLRQTTSNVKDAISDPKVIEKITTYQKIMLGAQGLSGAQNTAVDGNLRGWEAGMDLGAVVAGGPLGLAVMPYVLKKVEQLVSTWNEQFVSTTGGTLSGDPILKVAALGSDMVQKGVSIWIYSSFMIFGIAVGLSIMSSFSGMGQGVASSGHIFIPIILAIVVTLIVNGVVLSVYVPLIPFLIFFFTAVGWMMSVIEAIVAAPLVALGVTHPEGHDLLGKAEQSLMLLLSVFIKPTAMLIGFFAAMLLSRIGFEMLNIGLATALPDLKGGYTGFNLFSTLGFMIIYTLIVIAVVNFSFSLIHLLPDRIMRWIGVAPDSYGGEQQMGAIKSGLSGGMKHIAEGGAKSSIAKPTFSDQGAKSGQQAWKQSQGGKGAETQGGPGGVAGAGGGAPPPVA